MDYFLTVLFSTYGRQNIGGEEKDPTKIRAEAEVRWDPESPDFGHWENYHHYKYPDADNRLLRSHLMEESQVCSCNGGSSEDGVSRPIDAFQTEHYNEVE